MSDIKHLENLSKLELSEEERSRFEGEFEKILTFVDEIKSIEVDLSLDKDRPIKLAELRGDEVKESMSQELVLSNAPKQKDGCYNTPMVVE